MNARAHTHPPPRTHAHAHTHTHTHASTQRHIVRQVGAEATNLLGRYGSLLTPTHPRTGTDCQVHAFDPTVGGLPDVNASIFNGGGGAYGALGFGRSRGGETLSRRATASASVAKAASTARVEEMGGGGAGGEQGVEGTAGREVKEGRTEEEEEEEKEEEEEGEAVVVEEEEEAMVFHKQAIGAASRPSKMFLNVETLQDTMARLGHHHLDVLKVGKGE